MTRRLALAGVVIGVLAVGVWVWQASPGGAKQLKDELAGLSRSKPTLQSAAAKPRSAGGRGIDTPDRDGGDGSLCCPRRNGKIRF